MLKITPDAEKFIVELLDKNKKSGCGVKVYLSGYACSGPQFGMSFQEKPSDDDKVDKTSTKFDLYYDEKTGVELEKCVIEFVDDPNFGTGLSISDPTFQGCSSCGGSCR